MDVTYCDSCGSAKLIFKPGGQGVSDRIISDPFYKPSERELEYRWFDEFYWTDEERETLWVRSPKVGSKSLRTVINFSQDCLKREVAEVLNKVRFTVGTLRHPLDRVCSGLTGTLLSPKDTNPALRLRYYRGNCHVRPLSRMFAGLRVDYWLNFETFNEDFKGLWKAHKDWCKERSLPLPEKYPEELPFINSRNERQKVSWKDFMSWGQFLDDFEDDWSLNPEWERP